MSNDKLAAAMDQLAELARAADLADRPAALGALADSVRALKRIVNRATPHSEEYERIELVQDRGPTIEFTGKLLCETSFITRGEDPLRYELEIYQTAGGALVCARYVTPEQSRAEPRTDLLVVEREDDVLAMRLAVMEFFKWDLRARSMVRKALGWSLKVEVE